MTSAPPPAPNWGLTDEAPKDKIRPRPRGFAAMDRDKVRSIASLGGKAAHAVGTAHRFTSEEARAAGKKGGVAPHKRRGRQKVVPSPPPTAPALDAHDDPEPPTQPSTRSP